jgi:sulfatase modifying factor 1
MSRARKWSLLTVAFTLVDGCSLGPDPSLLSQNDASSGHGREAPDGAAGGNANTAAGGAAGSAGTQGDGSAYAGGGDASHAITDARQAADADADARSLEAGSNVLDGATLEAGCSGRGCASCKLGVTRCSGAGVQTCLGDGGWGAAVPCGASTPFCYGGSCSATPPSCRDLATTCGVASDESCCTTLLVAGGAFDRSNDAADPATVSDFRLDKYEVTVGRFRKFVDDVVAGWLPAEGEGKHAYLNQGAGLSAASSGNHEQGWTSAWDAAIPSTKGKWDNHLSCDPVFATWTPDAGSSETRPINCVDWFQAYAFCIWDGGFLASEAEWNYAAAGGSQQRLYPWGATAPGANASQSIHGCYYGGGGPDSCTGFENIAPVGLAPSGNGRFGQADLSGNVYEWTLDLFVDPYPMSCFDCAVTEAGTSRVVRSGTFADDNVTFLSSTYRNSIAPATIAYDVGARCARAP